MLDNLSEPVACTVDTHTEVGEILVSECVGLHCR